MTADIQSRLTYEGGLHLNLGQWCLHSRLEWYRLQQIAKTVFARISVYRVLISQHSLSNTRKGLLQLFPQEQRNIVGYLDDEFAFLFWLPSPFQQTLAFTTCHTSYGPSTPFWLVLSSSTLVWWACFFKLLLGFLSGALAWTQTSLPEKSLPNVSQAGCRSSRVTEHWGAFGAPSLTTWKVDPQWSLLHLYELHHHSDCCLK